MSEVVCTASNISKSYKNMIALDDVSIALESGAIYGLLGNNGAGKSTLTKIMCGLLETDSGEVQYYGYPLGQNYKDLKKYLAVVPQEVSCYHGFSVKENLLFFGLMYNIRGEELTERVEYLLDWLALKEFSEKAVNELSGGYKRLLNIACSLVNDPKIIFMDEPTVGLDPKMRHLLWEKIRELKYQGRTICLTTHYLDEAQALCDRVGMLFNGKLLVEGEPHDLIKKYGGYRVITLKLSKQVSLEDNEKIIQIFEGSKIVILGQTLVIPFVEENSIGKISSAEKKLSLLGYIVTTSTIKEPELEDVFLNITKMRSVKK